MQIIIDEVVSRITATTSEAALSEKTLKVVVQAVMEAIDAQEQRQFDQAEENATENYQQRVRPGH